MRGVSDCEVVRREFARTDGVKTMLISRTHTLAVIAALALAACNSSNSGPFVSPSPTPSPTPSPANLSGDYSGTIQDSANGSGTVTGTLAQHGTSAGGPLTIASASGTTTAAVSLAIAANNALSGAIVIDYPSGTTCTFSTAGSYNSTTNVITGTYSAVTNCSGQSGTYSLTQQCSDTVTSRRRTMNTVRC